LRKLVMLIDSRATEYELEKENQCGRCCHYQGPDNPCRTAEFDESPEQALIRELEEELLCSAEIHEHIETTEHEYDFGVIILTTYYCSLIGGEPNLTEHSEIRWVEAAELDQLEWAPADIPAVERVMKDFEV
jgi:8-oxo-dGTP diphosphatase